MLRKLAYASLAVAASSLISTPTYAQETLEVGIIGLLSGAGKPWGDSLVRATEMAAEDYNSQGGLEVNGERYLIEITAYDGKFRPAESLAAMNRIIYEDDINFVMGPQGAAATVGTQELSTQEKVVTMVFAWSPRVLGPDLPYQFGITFSEREFAKPQIEWVTQRADIKKVGGLFPNDEHGQQASKELKEIYESVGSELHVELFERGRVDFAPLLTRLIAQGVDAIELDGNAPATAGQIVKQARDMGFDGTIVRTGGPATAEILAVAGAEAADGIYFHSPFNPELEASEQFLARYKDEYGDDANFNGFTPSFYDAARMLFAAIEEAGSVKDTDEVRDALASMEFAGLQGELSWTGEEVYGIDRQISGPFYILQLNDGEEEIVATCTISGCE